MSQHTFSVPNQSRSAYRADVNSALQALASQSAGTSAPATMYAYELWADTTNGVIKQRNAANAAWILRATLAETLVVARSSNTVLALTDIGRTFIFTSTFSQTLTAAATLTDAWYCFVRNDGSGVITLDPDGSELIDGLATVALQPGDSVRIACTGSAFKTSGLPAYLSGSNAGQVKFPATQNASGDANTLDDYDEGDWTPGIAFGGGTTGIAYNAGQTTGKYTKIGRMVFCTFNITLTNKGSSSGNATITGLPFARNGDTNMQGFNSVVWGGMTSSLLSVGVEVSASVTTGFIRGATAVTTDLAVLQESAFGNATVLRGHVVYHV